MSLGERINMPEGRLITGDLGNAQGCILTFKYAADSYYGKLIIQALPSNSKSWREGRHYLIYLFCRFTLLIH